MRIRSPVNLAPVLALVSILAACAERQPPAAVPVYAAAADLFVLEGDWWGQYWSVETGRSGRIRLSLEAEADRAYGDVLMLPAARDGEPAAMAGSEAAAGETLRIEFVRIEAATETVSGTLAPYRDPDCDCVVATTFTGRVSRDSIEGDFLIQAGSDHGARRGRWRVERRQPADPG